MNAVVIFMYAKIVINMAPRAPLGILVFTVGGYLLFDFMVLARAASPATLVQFQT